jgi:hypothetical protein
MGSNPIEVNKITFGKRKRENSLKRKKAGDFVLIGLELSNIGPGFLESNNLSIKKKKDKCE